MDKKTEKKKQIILQAKEIFIAKGFFNTVMDDIAKKVGVARRTMYRYFESIEDLAYEATILMLNEWNDFHKELVPKLEGSGLIRLEKFLNESIKYMEDKKNVMKYLGEFDFYFAQDMHKEPSNQNAAKFRNIILKPDQLISRLIQEGIDDGSIKKQADVNIVVATISNVLWSFGQRVAARGELIKSETGIDGIDLIKYQIKLYIDALKEK